MNQTNKSLFSWISPGPFDQRLLNPRGQDSMKKRTSYNPELGITAGSGLGTSTEVYKHMVTLSEAQRKNLMQGKSVRVQHNTGTSGNVPLHLDPDQHNEFENNKAKGKASSIFRFSCPEQAGYHVQNGSGLFTLFLMKKGAEFILSRFNKMPKLIRNYLSKHGGSQIESIYLGRKPVVQFVKSSLNILSLGRFDKTRRELNYDDVYHSYLIIKLKGIEQPIKLEKNERFAIGTVLSEDYKEQYSIPLNKKVITLYELIDNAQKDHSDFWLYTPQRQNCQKAVYDIVSRNGLSPTDSRTLAALEPQRADKLINSLGSLSGIAEFVTNLGGVANVVRNGGWIFR